MRKKIIQEVTKTTTDQNGKFLSESKRTTGYANREPDYVKLYLQDLLRLKDIPKTSNSILLSILKRLSYDSNEIILISHVKNLIAKELEISVVTISKAIEAFTDKSILLRKGRGVYLVNPYLFGRGKWEEIEKIRLSVTYSEEGKMFLRTEFDHQTELELDFEVNKEPPAV